MSVHVEERAEGMDKGSSLKFCINNSVSQKFKLGNLGERTNKAFNMFSPNRRALLTFICHEKLKSKHR